MSLEAERRQLTVMFCDLVGSTALSGQLDPEELREVVRAYQARSAAIIERHAGHIAQYLGDGLLVYFGYPVAQEDAAVRAVRAGMEIIGALKTQPGLPLQARIGIHTGPVVVGEMGAGSKREQLALGETVHSRLDATVSPGLTPLVGREEELALLLRRWEQVKDREGQVVLLNGEPGIGKSRLVRELQERVEREGALHLEFHCSPYHQNSALYPVIEHLQRLLRWQKDDTPQAKFAKLQTTLARYHFPQSDSLALLAALLSLPHPTEVPPLNLSPERQRQKTQEVLVAWLLEEAEQAPAYCAWEDLHWADPSTLDLLNLLVDQAPTARLYVLLTCRPEFTAPWGKRLHFGQLTLSRLGRRQVPQMIEKVTGGKTFPSEVLQQIIAKTDGVPLFVEELTKTVIESGLLKETAGGYELTGALPPLAIPSTLHDSLMARLDRLAAVREVAQLGATLGREFAYDLLHAVSPLDERTLQNGLAQLVEAELLYQRGTLPQASYIFKHALIQDAAYQSLLKSTRQHYHKQIAQVLEERFPETVETQPELVAHHYTVAGLAEQALPYWQQAGQRAIERSANVEAIHHLTTALELLKTLPDTPEHLQQELTLHITLGVALIATKGFAASAVERVYARVLDLCRQVGETPQLFPGLWGSWVFYALRGKLQTAQELAARLLHLAQSLQDTALLLQAHHSLWATSFWRGELLSARVHAEQGIALYERAQHHSLAFLYGGHDPGGCCRNFGALTLWLLGYPDQADKRNQEALALARELSHPFSSAGAVGYAAWLFEFRRERTGVQEQAKALLGLAEEQGSSDWSAQGTILQGWALAERGQGEEGIAQIRQGLAALRATGTESPRPYYLALLAKAYGKVGRTEEGLSVLAEALEARQSTGARFYEAELYRLKGELTRKQSGVRGPESEVANTQNPAPSPQAEVEAEACFHKAIEIARQQRAKSLELRAVMSLSRLWQQQGKHREAHERLAEIYDWFTEGFNTKDLQEAKALLAEVAEEH
ncbi:MAG: AAA family ATPase [Deltaproteobacteria bacterium]|nr:AAA family ATPase [Deltaproteobacteria bacterium]